MKCGIRLGFFHFPFFAAELFAILGRQSIGCALGAFAFEERDRRSAGNDPQRLLSLPTETSHPSHHAREITKFLHR